MAGTRKSIPRKWRKILSVLVVAVLCGISVMIGTRINLESILLEKPYAHHAAKASYAFEETGLTPSFEIPYVLDGSLVGRDNYKQTIFEVPYRSEREELWGLIQNTDGWHAETITADDYRSISEITWYPSLVNNTIADDIEFDAWFYRETVPAVGYERRINGYFSFLGQAARGMEFAVFDKDTGLFIFIDQRG